jgi:hypothetical protein
MRSAARILLIADSEQPARWISETLREAGQPVAWLRA